MAAREQEVEQRLALVLGDVVAIPLRERKKTLVPDNRQLAIPAQIACGGFRIHGLRRSDNPAEAQEVEDDGVDDLEWERVFLLQEGFDEDVAGTCGVGVGGHLLGGDFAAAVQGDGGVQDGDGDFGDDGGDYDGFALGAGAVCEEGKQKALEKCAGFVERFLQGVVVVHVELVCLVDVVLDGGQEDGVEEDLGGLRLRRDEDAGCSEHGVGRPVLGACDS